MRRLGLVDGAAYDPARLAGVVDRSSFDGFTALVAIELLVTARGAAVTPPFVRRALRTLAAEAEVKRTVAPHMLRHTAATRLLEAGVDSRLVQRRFGHQSISTRASPPRKCTRRSATRA